MTISIDLFKAQVDSMIDAIDVEVSDWRRYQAIHQAVARYSVDRPDSLTEDVTGDGGRYYVIETELGEWVEGFSFIMTIEYPAAAIASDETPVYLDPEDWDDDYRVTSGGTETRYLYLPLHSPAATEDMRIKYARPYIWAAGGSEVDVAQAAHGLAVDDFIYLNSDSSWVKTEDNTYVTAHGQVTTVTDAGNFKYKTLYTEVPQIDFFAVCNLAACMSLQWLAAKYAKATDTTIGADSTTHTTRTSEFSQRAQEFCTLYNSHMGLGLEQVQHPAGKFVDWDTRPMLKSRPGWLFHNDLKQG